MALLQPLNQIPINKSLILLLLICSPFTLFAQDKHIDLRVYQNGTGYKMGFSNSECPGSLQDMGCIDVEHGNSPIISWELDAASDQDWELTRLQFSPDGQHWGDAGYPLQDCTMNDFRLSGDDSKSGKASSANVVANGRRLQIHDLNNNACTTHYKLFARPRAGGAEINSDPVIKNRGN
jgi:hypothetical protein